jgi:hypothetical protein
VVDIAVGPAVLALVARSAAPVADGGHPALYETSAALIITVLVVLYFDERVRRGLTARSRGYAIGSLGGVIGVGLLVPLFELAGFIADTSQMRAWVVGYTLVFLTAAFGAAISAWGAEDALRSRPAPPAVSVPPAAAPLPRGGLTELEGAAEVLGSAMFIMSQAHPVRVLGELERAGPGAEAARLHAVSGEWLALQPLLLAIAAGYPSAEVRERLLAFYLAVGEAIKEPASLFTGPGTVVSGEERVEWGEQAAAVFGAAEAAWHAVVNALHRGKKTQPKPARARTARQNGQPER